MNLTDIASVDINIWDPQQQRTFSTADEMDMREFGLRTVSEYPDGRTGTILVTNLANDLPSGAVGSDAVS